MAAKNTTKKSKTAVKKVSKPAKSKSVTKTAKPAAKKAKPATKPAKTAKAPKTVKEPKAAKAKKPSKADKAEIVKEPVVAAPRPERKITGVASVTVVPPDYDPKKDKGEFMNTIMAEYFRLKLIRWREELLRESSETIQHTLRSTELQQPDLADRASAETDHALELRTRDRERKLISKINEALLRIEDGSYGYCEETGEPISVARLEARPIATLSLEAQERHERMEKTHREE